LKSGTHQTHQTQVVTWMWDGGSKLARPHRRQSWLDGDPAAPQLPRRAECNVWPGPGSSYIDYQLRHCRRSAKPQVASSPMMLTSEPFERGHQHQRSDDSCPVRYRDGGTLYCTAGLNEYCFGRVFDQPHRVEYVTFMSWSGLPQFIDGRCWKTPNESLSPHGLDSYEQRARK
jgi:hypothetical protein